MSLTIIEGSTGSGKTVYAAQQCLEQCRVHAQLSFNQNWRIGYFTPLYEPNPAFVDAGMAQLIALNKAYPRFRLAKPVVWEAIVLKCGSRVFFDEVTFNTNATGTQPRDCYHINAIEFNRLSLEGFYRRCRTRHVALTLITQVMPPTWVSILRQMAGTAFHHLIVEQFDVRIAAFA